MKDVKGAHEMAVSNSLHQQFVENRGKRPTDIHKNVLRYSKGTAAFDLSSEQRTCDPNPAGENSSFTFTVCFKSAPLYYFKPTYVATSEN